MRIAFVNPPLSEHFSRGTGTYAKGFIDAVEKYCQVEIISAEARCLPKKVDIYHFPYFDPFFLTLPFFRKNKTIVTIHDLIPIKFAKHFPRGIKGEIKWQIQKQNIRRVSSIITDSYASKADIMSIVGLDEKMVQVVYLAPDEQFFIQKDKAEKERVRNKYHLEHRFALFVGDVNWNKNLSRSIEAATTAKMTLVVVSKPFAEANEVKYNPWRDSLIEARELARGNPIIRGIGMVSREELVTLYQLATVLLFPSYYEGFGLPVTEAFAAGCPVITTHRGSLKEVAGEAAIIVDPDNTQAIISALTNIVGDSELRHKYIRLGKERVQQFSWEKTAKATYKIYQEVCNL